MQQRVIQAEAPQGNSKELSRKKALEEAGTSDLKNSSRSNHLPDQVLRLESGALTRTRDDMSGKTGCLPVF
jgi:hypothetical protein